LSAAMAAACFASSCKARFAAIKSSPNSRRSKCVGVTEENGAGAMGAGAGAGL
jgi:hypothetical protein